MNDSIMIYIFIFVLVSNFILSLFYAIGTANLRDAVKRSFDRRGTPRG